MLPLLCPETQRYNNANYAADSQFSRISCIVLPHCFVVVVVFLMQTLFEFKFEFLRVVCNHEHYVPLNLPMPFGKGRILRFQGGDIYFSLDHILSRRSLNKMPVFLLELYSGRNLRSYLQISAY